MILMQMGTFIKSHDCYGKKLPVKYVESAFMGVTDPRVEEGIERCVKLGAKKIIMLPYFFIHWYFNGAYACYV
ncbi:CbiX/SirB N-terminal domain-containing protein [Lysinibacillus sp. MHQ-1]|nr:CbiX/SirB N-terminal domain-containing protein [Lysinibacillus sp. MHQ-1]